MFKSFHEPLYFSNEVIRLQESRQSLFSPRGPSATIATTNPKESQQLRGEIAPFSIVYDFYPAFLSCHAEHDRFVFPIYTDSR